MALHPQRSLLLIVIPAFVFSLNTVAGQQRNTPPSPQPQAEPKTLSAAPPSKAAAAVRAAEFDRLLTAATEARRAQRWEDAIELYGKVVRLKPNYVEGYWYQGTAYYTLDDYA